MKTAIKVIHWVPRILCIIAILIISLFAADAFAPGLSIGEQIRDFIIHLVPSFILLALLIVAWKWELVGGIIFMLIGLGLSPVIFKHNYNMNHSIWMSLGIILTITIPFFIVGLLFVVSHFRKKKHLKETASEE